MDVPNRVENGILVAGNYRGFEIDQSLRDEIPPSTSVEFGGVAGISVETSPVSTISFPVNGQLDYCFLKSGLPSVQPGCGEPPDQVLTHSACRSMNHRLMLTRR
jgi:hypothetical protein